MVNAEEFEALFGGLLAIGDLKIGVIAFEVEELSICSTSMPSETLVSLEEDDNFSRNTSAEIQCSKKKKRKKTQRNSRN